MAPIIQKDIKAKSGADVNSKGLPWATEGVKRKKSPPPPKKKYSVGGLQEN